MTRTLHRLERCIRIPPADLQGDLVIPHDASGIVIFAHGSGSSRLSPRNRSVADQLQRNGLATLLFDLLTRQEEQVDARTAQLRFDIPFLAGRLMSATDWLQSDAQTSALKAGYFGASTGAAAALNAAGQRPMDVAAIVSRGGRPDLAGAWLKSVIAPTLLIVGGNDGPVIDMNRSAFRELTMADKRIEIVPGASHLFEEPGALQHVAKSASEWFQHYLR